jgi:hypothetical protein
MVELYGYPGLDSSDIRWYMNLDPTTPCRTGTDWSSALYTEITAQEIVSDRTSQIEKSSYRLSYTPPSDRLCIIAGIGGDTTVVEERYLSEYTITGSIIDTLSPEYDMQSQVEFRFSSDIYADTGSLYSTEYIEHRRREKIEFLKRLDITPSIPLTDANISLTPDRATII